MSQQPVVFFGNVGRLEIYEDGDDWKLYRQRLVQYFVANDVQGSRRVAVLLTSISKAVYRTLNDLCDPELPESKTFDELCNLLDTQFSPRTSVWRKRIEFYKMQQTQDEPIAKYYARLKSLAALCNFGNDLNNVLRDRFVSGLSSGKILDRLCEEAETKTIQELLELALKKETALSEMSTSIHKLNAKQKFQNKHKKRSTIESTKTKLTAGTSSSASQLKCYACGNTNHNFSNCRYKKYKCKTCNEIGHISKVCKKAEASTNYMSNQAEKSEASEEEIAEMFNFNNSQSIIEPVKATIKINGKPIIMEVDSGAGMSVLSYDIYRNTFKDIPLQPSNIKLKMYDGSMASPVGEIFVTANYGEYFVPTRLLIVKSESRPLLGRDLMSAFKMLKNFQVKLSAVDFKCDKNIEDKLCLQSLLTEFASVFESGIGTYKYEKIQLNLKSNASPVFCKPRPIPFAFRDLVDAELNKLEKQGVITKVESSRWGTPLVPVLRANKTLRLCANYSLTVNPHLEDVNYPLPKIEEIFTAVQGGQKFTKLDFKNAFNQLLLDQGTRELLAWSTHKGTFLVNRLPFGTKPASAIFQMKAENVLRDLKGVAVYIDDIFITGKTEKEHLSNLRAVLTRLKEAGFKLNMDKCEFFRDNLHFLGHVIDAKGLHMDQSKVRAIEEAPRPSDVTQVRAFVGMVNYYGRFIPNLPKILQPLYQLLTKNVTFHWDRDCEESFNEAKSILKSDVVLAHYDPTIPVKLATDASQHGIGAVLLHIYPNGAERPIAFASRVLSKAEKGYSVIHKEALAIYWGVKKFSQYLVGRRFILASDHKPLLALFGEKRGIPVMAASRLQRWAIFLSDFNYELRYVKGSENGGADGLSRLPISTSPVEEDSDMEYLHFMEGGLPMDYLQIREATRSDPLLSRVMTYINDSWPSQVEEDFKPFYARRNELNVDQGILMWGYRIVLPKKVRSTMLKQLHESHFGITKLKQLARSYLWYPNMDQDLENLVKSCEICMSFRAEPEKASLIKWPQTEKPFERIHLDFAGPFKGHMFLICIDSYSKWPEVFIMKSTDATSTIETLREIFARFGLPSQIVTDNGAQFTSKEFAAFCVKNKIKHSTSPAFHPSTNGAAENFVKTLKMALAKVMKDPKNTSASIRTLLNRFLFAYRNAPHCVTGETPVKLMFNRNVRTLLDLTKPTFKKKQIEDQQEYYKGTRDTVFQEGDLVMARDYRTLNKKTWTPAVIAEVLGSRTYLVKLKTGEVWKRHLDQLLTAAHNNDCIHNPSNLDVSTDDRIPTVISYKDKGVSQSVTPVIQNDIEKPNQNGTNKPFSISSNRNHTVTAPCNSKGVSSLPTSMAGNSRSSRLRKKPERYTPS